MDLRLVTDHATFNETAEGSARRWHRRRHRDIHSAEKSPPVMDDELLPIAVREMGQQLGPVCVYVLLRVLF